MGSLPTLVTADWCPFTMTAISLWKEAATACGQALRVVVAGSEEGEQVIAAANVAGVPCCVSDSDRKFYGIQLSPSEAESFLQSPGQ